MKKLTVNGIELARIERGTGPVVLLVHGFPLDHSMWDAQIDALSAEYRVIAPDLRGFGQSGVDDATVTMERFADDLAALLDGLEIGEPIALAGLSMGGYIAFQFWRKHSARLRALMLLDTRAVGDTAETSAGRLQMAGRVLREGAAPLVDSMMPRLFGPGTVQDHPQVVESLRRVMLAGDPRGIAAAARGMAERPDVRDMLPKIACPTLVVVGQQDTISTPEEMRAIARAIPGARFAQIAASGHMTTMEKPAEVNAALLEFLNPLSHAGCHKP